MKNAVFWDVEPFGFIINRRLGWTCRLRLHRRRHNASNVIFLLPWIRRRCVPPKRRFIINPHGATPQNTSFFSTLVYKAAHFLSLSMRNCFKQRRQVRLVGREKQSAMQFTKWHPPSFMQYYEPVMRVPWWLHYWSSSYCYANKCNWMWSIDQQKDQNWRVKFWRLIAVRNVQTQCPLSETYVSLRQHQILTQSFMTLESCYSLFSTYDENQGEILLNIRFVLPKVAYTSYDVLLWDL
jgi:hypothetical protein